MVEPELRELAKREEFHLRGLAVALFGDFYYLNQKCRINCIAARIPPFSRVHANKAYNFSACPCFFPQLPQASLLDRFVIFHEAAGKRPASSEWRIIALDKKHGIVPYGNSIRNCHRLELADLLEIFIAKVNHFTHPRNPSTSVTRPSSGPLVTSETAKPLLLAMRPAPGYGEPKFTVVMSAST